MSVIAESHHMTRRPHLGGDFGYDKRANGLRQPPGSVTIECESELVPGRLDVLLGGGEQQRNQPRP